MKVISVYELLGMIKDDKAPLKVKYTGDVYEYNFKDKEYYRPAFDKETELYEKVGLFINDIDDDLTDCLIDRVEVIEEDKKIEKLTTSLIDIKVLTDEVDTKLDYSGDYDRLVNKINEIIDKINKGE